MAQSAEPLLGRPGRPERPGERHQLGTGAADGLGRLGRARDRLERGRQCACLRGRGQDRVAVGGREGQRIEQRCELLARDLQRRDRERQPVPPAVLRQQPERAPGEPPVRDAERRMNRSIETQRVQALEGGDGIALLREQPQLVADACAADRRQRAAVDQRSRVGVDGEAQAAGVAGQAEHARRVVDEARFVEHAQAAARAGPPALQEPSQAAVGERQRDRVDGEIAPQQILLEARRDHVGQRAGMGVGLAPGPRDVVAEAVEGHGRGPEPVVDAQRPSERPREGQRVSLDHQVEVVGRAAEQQIAHGAADQVHVRGSAHVL